MDDGCRMLSDVGTVTDSESGIAVGVCTMSSAATLVDPDTVDDAITVTMCVLDVTLFVGVAATVVGTGGTKTSIEIK